MSFSRAFERLTQRLAVHSGAEALLRGSVACRVHVEHDVEMVGTYGEMPVRVSVATFFDRTLAPRRNEPLVLVDTLGQPIPGESYVIDGPAFADNGHSVRFPLRRV